MTEVTIRANAPVLGLVRDQETRVERTPFIDAAAKNGYVTVVEDHSPAVEADEPAPEPKQQKRARKATWAKAEEL
jgi:hypothetical protein